MRTYRTICNVLLVVIIAFLFSGCGMAETSRTTAPIISIRYASGTGNYLVVLEGRKAATVHQTDFRITINFSSEPALTFSTDGHGRILYKPDYEFIFSDYEQAKKHLQLEPRKDAQIYVKSESKASGCFISTSIK